jgi:hypothetical protein
VRKTGDSVTAERMLEAMEAPVSARPNWRGASGATPGAINQIATG